ncbi:hypothetical protein CAPTEDRAFT_19755 [Capitella teleta]|uniref:W2 domain-containing protein n=1 Tax=Capitella teleta TaxID=283909 RepID=R7VEW2_CAPTE|nr:hypothetical protein CAPTEDRAFT_19755 [Capitella teleta]|eukprot:ELU17393.1 hypothetical protein CAPTEDRAFT_19755 [Capitella teleta]
MNIVSMMSVVMISTHVLLVPDQWSPLNLEGKKQYDRAFLLQLQFANESLEKPTNLPGLDVILDAPMRHNEQPRGDRGPPSMKQMIDFTPGFVKSSPSGSKGQMGPGGMRSRSRQKDQRPPGKVISIQRSEDVTLKRAKNAWKPPAKVASADGVSQELVEQEVFRKVRAILNKLTPQNFQTLIPQFAELEISTESLLKGAIMIVFEKAISEPAFSVTYANLCKRLGQVKVPSDKDPSQMVVFRNLLVVQCQIEFQKDKAAEVEDAAKLLSIEAAESEEEKKQLRLELEYARTMARRRSNGNIRFIGELYKLDVLLEKIMHECVHKLLKAKDEESMECLCGLLTTIGKKIDVKNGTKLFDQYFQRIETIVNNRQFSSRVRFMLQDVIDLRKNKWIPRREDKGPKMISEVHDEAEREKQEKAALLHSLPPQDKRSRGPGPNRGQQGGGPQQQSDDGWTSLGPGGRGGFSWARGSSGGSKPSSQEAEKSSAPANRFSALSGAEDARGRGSSATSAPGSRNQSRESSRNRERSREPPTSEASRPAAVAQPAAKEFTDEEVERKTTYLVDELLLNNDLKSARKRRAQAVLNYSLSCSLKALSQSPSSLKGKLCGGHSLHNADCSLSLQMDIPNVWAYFGELLAPSLVSGALPLDALQAICKPCMAFSKAHVLAAAALKATADIIGLEKVADMWRLAQMQWQDFTPSSCDLNEFLTQNKLEMLNATELTIGQIKSELLRIVQPKMTNDAILEWIAENVTEVQRKDSQFVRALMTAVCSSVIIDHEAKKQLNVPALKDRATLLQIYLDHDGNLELQALYALQALMVSMHHPSGLLRTFFDVLYDEDLISEDSFFKWDSSDDAAEAGKGVARHSVRQFFTWLHEPSEDQEDA